MFLREVSGGIYIDYGCTAVIHISDGAFIPFDGQTSDGEVEFQKDWQAFKDKWFSSSTEKGEIKDCL